MSADIAKASGLAADSLVDMCIATRDQEWRPLKMGTLLPKIGTDSTKPIPDQLCTRCQTVFEGDYDLFDDWPPPRLWIHHHNENDLAHSASMGCHFCSLILHALQKNRRPRPQHDIVELARQASLDKNIVLGLELQSKLGHGEIMILAPKSERNSLRHRVGYMTFTPELGMYSSSLYTSRVVGYGC